LKEINPDVKIRGKGLMIGLEFSFPVKELREKLLFEHRIFTGFSGQNILRLLPPLSLAKQDCDIFLTAYEQALLTIDY